MPKGTFNQKFKEPLNKEFLEQHYLTLNKSVRQIMTEFNLSASKIIKALKRYGFQKPAELKYKKGNPELKTKEALEQMYNIDKLSITQIAEKFKCTPGSVTKLFKSRGIPIQKNLKYERRRDFIKLRSARKKLKKDAIELSKETNRQRFRTGAPMSPEAKSKSRIKAIERGVKNQNRTPVELKTSEILRKLNAKFQEQLGILLYQGNICTEGYIVDFLILNDKQPIVLEVDSDYHHNISKIVEKDKIENQTLITLGFKVIRLNSEYVSEKQITECLNLANQYNGVFVITASDKIEKQPLKIDKNRETKFELVTYNKKLNKIIKKG